MTLHDQIRRTLAQAHELDLAARRCRQQAGALLVQAREQNPQGHAWYQGAGLDALTAEMLLQMATGGKCHE